jgi:4-amino-4-deoxy-L-arabinose transferase-like glycosyltransferase
MTETKDQTAPGHRWARREQRREELLHPSEGRLGRDLLALGIVALGVVALHVATNGRYGFHRDELQVLDDARHMDWGFVAYPPVTPLLERILLGLFGASLIGLRMFSVLAQGAAILVTGLMARELGGQRLAQIVAALAVVVSPLPLFEGTEFQYSTFDYLWCTLITYSLIRLLKSENPRWWLAIGAAIGVGMMTKYTMAFFTTGIVGGVLLTPARRYLKSPWLWSGAALSVLIFLPNLLWQIHHDFVSLHFLQHIHTRDIGEGRANGFVRDQFLISTNLFAAQLWLAGLYYFFAAPDGRRYRLLAWLYVIAFLLYFFGKGRGYYLAPAYPVLFAAGSLLLERWAATLSTLWSRIVYGVTFAALAVGGVFACALILPLGPISPASFALRNNEDLREEIGWTDLVSAVAQIRDSLSPAERASFGIITGNYGETGALDLYGPAYGLPPVLSGTNTAWYRGYGHAPPQTLIAVGISGPYLESHLQSCRLAGHNGNPYGIHNEESLQHPDIFVCGAPRNGWAEFWKDFQWFG